MRKFYGAWLISGLLLGVGFVVPALWFLGFFGAASCAWCVWNESTLRRSILGLWLAFTIKAAFAVSFFWATYPIEWLPLELGEVQILFIGVYWFTTALWLGSGAVFMAAIIWLMKQKKWCTYFHTALVMPFAWVAAEIIGSLIFSIMFYGPGGAVTTAFSFGFVGYLVAESYLLLQLATLGGVYFLSFFVVTVSVALVGMWQKSTRNGCVVGVSSVLFFLLLTWYQPIAIIPETGHLVTTVDTTFPRNWTFTETGRNKITQVANTAMDAVFSAPVEYVLLPEGAGYFKQQQPLGPQRSTFLARYTADAVVVDSGPVQVSGKNTLQAIIYSSLSDSFETTQKRYLVPQGEFMPTLYAGLLNVLGYEGAVEYIANAVSYEPAADPSQTHLASSTPGILFCFESVSPYGVRSLVREHPEAPFIAHPVSHAWFHEPNVLWQQLDAMLQVQAVWNQKYIVSAGNHVASRVITPNGLVYTPPVTDQGKWWVVRRTIIPET